KEVDELRLGMHRVQVVFKEPVADEALRGMFDLASLSRTGSLCTLVIRGEREMIEEKIEAAAPLFCEFLSLSLEEVFIREMEAVGYDFEEIVF
ncbi:MAG: ABC transporter ATP-binding protein, partial [Clostridia bacterium]|nr:ABC transporter ATP-binding protein [Clostridia bacterium]